MKVSFLCCKTECRFLNLCAFTYHCVHMS